MSRASSAAPASATRALFMEPLWAGRESRSTPPSEQPAGFVGETDGLRAGAGARLSDRGRQVVPHGPLRQVQRGGEIGDGASVPSRPQYVRLPARSAATTPRP